MKALVTLVVLAVALALGGCKKGTSDDDLCAHLGKFVDNGTYSKEECKKDLEGMKKDCKSWDAFVECAMSKNTEDALNECEAKCK